MPQGAASGRLEAADAPLPFAGASVVDDPYDEHEVGADDDGEEYGEEAGEGEEGEEEGEYEEYEEYGGDDDGAAEGEDGPGEGSEEAADEASEEPKKKVEVATIVPTRGAFFLHDDRCDNGGGRRYKARWHATHALPYAQAPVMRRRRHTQRKKIWESTNDDGEWKHDKFHELSLEAETRAVSRRFLPPPPANATYVRSIQPPQLRAQAVTA